MITLTEKQRVERRAQIRRGRIVVNQPWPSKHEVAQAKAVLGLLDDGVPDMRTRLSANQQRVYEKRGEIVQRLRTAGSKNVAELAKECAIDEHFIRWLDGRSRA